MADKVSAICGDNVSVIRNGQMMIVSFVGANEIEQLQKAIDGYLNTRADAPRWMFDLSDALNPIPVPQRRI
jgi:hypothetical protein